MKNGGKPPLVEPTLRREAMLRYRDGESIHRISAATGIPFSQVHRLVTYWRKKSPYEQKPCVCGRPARHPGGCIKNTPGAVGKLEKARIVAATAAGEMPHQIAARLGLHVQTVLKHSAATRDQLFVDGISCSCGRPIGHPYWCSAKWDAYEQPRGRRPFAPPVEREAIAALIRGDLVADIAKKAGVGTDSVYRLRATLPDEAKAARSRAIRARIAQRGKAEGETIMAQIERAVSRRIDPMLRDDVVGELYLAVMEGRLEADKISAAVRSFVNRGLSEWQSAYGPKSLDAKFGPDDGRSLVEMIRDDTGGSLIDDIEIGGD